MTRNILKDFVNIDDDSLSMHAWPILIYVEHAELFLDILNDLLRNISIGFYIEKFYTRLIYAKFCVSCA